MDRWCRPTRRDFLLASGVALAAGLPPAPAAEAPRVPTVDEHIRRLAEEAPLSMEFRGTTAEECRTWQGEFAAKLRALLGPHQPPARWRTEVEHVADLPDHRREELVLSADGHPPLPVYLLLPRETGGQAAARRPGPARPRRLRV